jgi:hypothetical protein
MKQHLIIKYVDHTGHYIISEPFEPKDLAQVLKKLKQQSNPTHLTLTYVKPGL